MIKRLWFIFIRDLKVNTREFISLYIIVVPILFAILINLLSPGINDTTVNLALIEGEDQAMVEYLADFAKVKTYKDQEALEERILRRDQVFGIIASQGTHQIVSQGNELEGLLDYTRLLLTFYEEDVKIEDSTAIIHDFGRSVPPLKKMLVNLSMMFSTILGGMLIAINIIEEKVDRTIRAMHLSPVSRTTYILGKSLIGLMIPFYGSLVLVIVTGFGGINWLQFMVLLLVSCIISLLVGFIQGINNESVMDAAGSVKMMFLPMAGAVAAAELLGEKWQVFFYWIPFYWTYKGMDAILSYTATWSTIILYAFIVLGISILVYLLLMPRIRKGLE